VNSSSRGCSDHALSVSFPCALFFAQAVVAGPGDENWDGAFGVPGTDGPVWAVTAQGKDLYVAGSFTQAGGVAANNVAKWNGTNWCAPGL